MSRAMYARPRSLEQAAALLGALDTGAMIIAGGQELMPYINYGHMEPAVLVDISGLKELTGIRLAADGALEIGALSVHRDIAAHADVQAVAPLLAHAVTQVGGGRQVHNRGTIGGNIVSMNTLYDVIPPLLALGAQVELLSGDASRQLALADLMSETGHGLGSSAILVKVIVPVQAAGSAWGYQKLKISEGAYSSATAAVMLATDASGHLAQLRLAVGAVGERPQDMSAAVASLLGQAWTPHAETRLESQVCAAVRDPLDDQRGPADYRRAMAGVVARRAVNAALATQSH